MDEMHLEALIYANTGWTSFSGVLSTVFPLAVVIAVLLCYAVASRWHQ
ncbi:MAG TPA: hypothetical protein VHS74_18780 [Solirubrobacterales bacterium]|nr:hypothetical protein [Solirubrobacterales bacterium]